LELGNHHHENVATGAIAPKLKTGGRVGLAKGKTSIPTLGADVIHHYGL